MDTADHLGLSAQDLSCRRHDRLLFSGLGLQVQPGEVLEVCGPNGSGKTTLLRILCGLRQPDTGAILWQGSSITKDPTIYRGMMCYLGHRQGMNSDLSPYENLRVEADILGLENAQIPKALVDLGLSSRLQNLPCRQLSAGQKQRASLARLLMRKAALWILDEPIASLDGAAQQLVLQLLAQHVNTGGMVVFTTHQPMQLDGIAVKQLMLGQGEVPC